MVWQTLAKTMPPPPKPPSITEDLSDDNAIQAAFRTLASKTAPNEKTIRKDIIVRRRSLLASAVSSTGSGSVGTGSSASLSLSNDDSLFQVAKAYSLYDIDIGYHKSLLGIADILLANVCSQHGFA
jgi:hypothetical protein